MKIKLNIVKIAFSVLIVSAVVAIAGVLQSSKNRDRVENKKDLVLRATLLPNAKKNIPVYGFNGETIKAPKWTNRQFLDTAATFNLKIIRYPGGTISNWWDWKHGWFLPDTVKRMRKPQGYTMMKGLPNDLSNLKILVDKTKCDVVFTLNMVTSDVNDQIEMLRAVERMGMRIKYVELGNEYNLKENDARDKFATVEDYAKECNVWIHKIKSIFPSVKIAVVGGNKGYSPDARRWNDEILKYAPDADALVAHIYPLPNNIIDEDGINFKSLYNEFNKGFTTQGFDNIPANKKIWMTEYNIHWAYAPDKQLATKRAFQQHLLNWDDVLAVILMTSEASSFSRQMEMVLNHNLGNINIFGAIEVEKNTFKKLPNGIGMEAWLTACNDMAQMQKLSFSDGSNTYQDYEILGWQFSNTQNANTLIVNFLPTTVKINAGTLITKNASCVIKSAGKNDVATAESIKINRFNINSDSQIEMPPYSFAIIRQ